jgi:hypothetical protein
MSAYQRFESQPPPVSLTYPQAKQLAASDTQLALSGPAVIHKVPYDMTMKIR